jgi:hypothetical protein
MGKTVREVLQRVSKTRRKSGGDKKHGRNLAKCARYKSQNRREKNKIRRQKKHLKRVEKKVRRLVGKPETRKPGDSGRDQEEVSVVVSSDE